MNFRQLSALLMFWRRGEVNSKDTPYSIVLLMRRPHVFTEAELIIAAEKGWGRRFDGNEDPMWFVGFSDALTVLKAGKYAVQVIQAKQPYSNDLEASAKNLPRSEQKTAWFEHSAWVSLDLWNGAIGGGKMPSKKEAYAVLARFALHLGDSNCSAIYFPKEGWMLPNNGEAEEELLRLVREYPLV